MVINKDFTQKKRRMRKLFSVAIIIVATMFANIAIAQNITGKVTDEQNHPFPYVNVLLQRADSSYIAGTITAEYGTFTIKSTPEGKLLNLSFVGSQTICKEIDVADFDETGSMTVKLSYGVTVDSILATVSGNYATVSDAVKVDDDTYTIAVTAGNGTEKIYTVNFEWARTTSTQTTAGFNTSVFVQAKTTYIDSPMDNANMVTRTYQDTTTSIHASGLVGDATKDYSGKTNYPSVALIELDLSKLTDLDTTKETNLYMYGSLGSYGTSGNADVIVSFYDATGTDMDAVTIEDLREYGYCFFQEVYHNKIIRAIQ